MKCTSILLFYPKFSLNKKKKAKGLIQYNLRSSTYYAINIIGNIKPLRKKCDPILSHISLCVLIHNTEPIYEGIICFSYIHLSRIRL